MARGRCEKSCHRSNESPCLYSHRRFCEIGQPKISRVSVITPRNWFWLTVTSQTTSSTTTWLDQGVFTTFPTSMLCNLTRWSSSDWECGRRSISNEWENDRPSPMVLQAPIEDPPLAMSRNWSLQRWTQNEACFGDKKSSTTSSSDPCIQSFINIMRTPEKHPPKLVPRKSHCHQVPNYPYCSCLQNRQIMVPIRSDCIVKTILPSLYTIVEEQED